MNDLAMAPILVIDLEEEIAFAVKETISYLNLPVITVSSFDYIEGVINEHQPRLVFAGLSCDDLDWEGQRQNISMERIKQANTRMMTYLEKSFPVQTIYMTYEPITSDGLWRYGDEFLVGNQNRSVRLIAGVIRKPPDPFDVYLAINRALFPAERLEQFLLRIDQSKFHRL